MSVNDTLIDHQDLKTQLQEDLETLFESKKNTFTYCDSCTHHAEHGCIAPATGNCVPLRTALALVAHDNLPEDHLARENMARFADHWNKPKLWQS